MDPDFDLAFPQFIAPLFNRFSPLSDDALKRRSKLCWSAADSRLAAAYS